jgi:hypothetical protein
MQHHRWVEKEPAGVVAAIIAYNYPNQLALAKLAPALAAGCRVGLTAAPATPLITLALGELIAEHTDIPAGVVKRHQRADPQVGAVLTTDPGVDMVTFTGPPRRPGHHGRGPSHAEEGVPGARRASWRPSTLRFRLRHRGSFFPAFSMVTHAGSAAR